MSANTDSDDPDVHDIISCGVLFFMKNGRAEVHFLRKEKFEGANSPLTETVRF